MKALISIGIVAASILLMACDCNSQCINGVCAAPSGYYATTVVASPVAGTCANGQCVSAPPTQRVRVVTRQRVAAQRTRGRMFSGRLTGRLFGCR